MTKKENHLELLGINQQHIDDCKAPIQVEALELVKAEADVFGRAQLMAPTTLGCWQLMKDKAKLDSIDLQLVSAYRSIEYQCNLIQGKIESGRNIDEILKVNTIPGYSEHHTGRALDLTTPGFDVLEESFEKSEAFFWLTKNASLFHFTMTYPQNNKFGIIYEPWHWFCNEE